MSGSVASGSTMASFLPASLAALLSRPIDAAAVSTAPIETRSLGSFFSSSPGLPIVPSTTGAPSSETRRDAPLAPSGGQPPIAPSPSPASRSDVPLAPSGGQPPIASTGGGSALTLVAPRRP